MPVGFNFTSKRATPEQPVERIFPVMHIVPSDNQFDTYEMLNRIIDDLQTVDESITILPARWFFEQLEQRTPLPLQRFYRRKHHHTPSSRPAGTSSIYELERYITAANLGEFCTSLSLSADL